MKASDVITTARHHINDPTPGTTWTDADFYIPVRLACNAILRDHPEARRQANGSICLFQEDITAATDDLRIAEMYLEPAAHWVAAHYFTGDSGDKRDEKRMILHRALYKGFFDAEGG